MIDLLFVNLDDWHDFIRILIVLSGLLCLIGLCYKFNEKHTEWTEKTKDYWFSGVMWALVSISFGSEGIIRDRPLGPTLILVFFATASTFKGLLKKGTWGEN